MSRRTFSLPAALGWSLTWAVGVALGVALGAYLTVLGAAAAPGEVLRPDARELVLLPAVAAGAVFVVSVTMRLIYALIRRVTTARDRDQDHAE